MPKNRRTADQGSLFETAFNGDTVPRSTATLLPTPAEADASRDAGIERAASGRKVPADFVEQATAFVLAYLADHGPTSGEVVTAACVAAGIDPGELRAFGQVYLRLSKAGKIVVVGSCKRMRGNGCNGASIWGLAP